MEIVALGEPLADDVHSLTRVKCRLQQHDVVGWVTLSGNGGTVCLEAKEYVLFVSKICVLQAEFGSASPSIRRLDVDEVLEVLEVAEEEKLAVPMQRMKIRACHDAAVGWVDSSELALKGD